MTNQVRVEKADPHADRNYDDARFSTGQRLDFSEDYHIEHDAGEDDARRDKKLSDHNWFIYPDDHRRKGRHTVR